MSLVQKAKSLLKKNGANAIKSLGQNFLVNESVLDKIVTAAELDENDFVIEIGPGLGFLTTKLAEHSKHVLAVEIDSKMVQILMGELPTEVKVLHGDALEINWLQELHNIGWQGEPIKVVANLPYYITTPILFMFLEGRLPIATMVMMMQKEVAERINAQPGGKIYGALSVAVQYYCKTSSVCRVTPGSFLPQPDVDSAVIKFEYYKEKPWRPQDEKMFFLVVKAAFSQRRKTLRNTLGNVFPDLKEELPHLLEELGIDSMRRGETLSIQEFVAIADKIAVSEKQ